MRSRRSLRAVAGVLVVAAAAAAAFALTRGDGPQSAQAAAHAAPGPAVWVTPKGDDTSCARGFQAQPCASWDRAYHLAQPGDVVEIAGGTYPTQSLTYDGTKHAPNVVLRVAAGAKVTIDEHLLIGAPGDTPSIQYATIDGGADRRIHVLGGIFNSYVRGIRTKNVTLEGITVGPSWFQPVSLRSVDHFTMRNMDIGPVCCDDDGVHIALGNPGEPQSTHWTLDRVRVHDVVTDCADIPAGLFPDCAAKARPFAGNHVDCVQSLGGDTILITRSQMLNCAGGTWMNGVGKGALYRDITVENSEFQGHVVTLGCGGQCGGQYAVSGYVHFYYNTMPEGIYAYDWKPGGDYRFVGNITQDIPPNHGRCTIEAQDPTHVEAKWAVAEYNLFSKGRCGPTDVVGPVRFVNGNRGADGIDLTVLAGASIAHGDPDLRPAVDVAGKRRPVRWRADIGAWQHEDAAIVLGSSIGGIALGETRAEVEAARGRPTRTAGAQRFYSTQRHGIWVGYDGGKVVSLATASEYYATDRGLGVGSPAAAARALGKPQPCGTAQRYSRRGAAVDVTVARGKVARIAFGSLPSCG